MFMGSSVVRRTPLAEKVFSRAAEIEREKQEKAAREADAKAIAEANELSRRVIAKRKAERMLHVYARVENYQKRIRTADVLRATCHHFKVTQAMITGDTRVKEIILPRQIGMFVAYRYCRTSFPAIGAVFKRDHSTVIHSIRKVDQLISIGDRYTTAAVAAILSDVRSVSVEDQPYWGA